MVLRLAGLGLCFAAWSPAAAAEEYHEYLDPVERKGLRRTVVQPDGGLLRLELVERGTAVRGTRMDEEGNPHEGVDVSAPEMQGSLLANERGVHGLADWPHYDLEAMSARHALWRHGSTKAPACAVPEDTHLERAAQEIYEALIRAGRTLTSRLLQVGDLGQSSASDVARSLLRRFRLQGLVAVGAAPEDAHGEFWLQGPGRAEVEVSVEGGAALHRQIGQDWAEVDVVRLDQDLPGSCQVLHGLLARGLQTAMVVAYVNSQFPPPLRFMSFEREGMPTALNGCSISLMVEMLRPHGFHLARLSGPYAAFVHDRWMSRRIGPRNADEFECYRQCRVWGFSEAFPITYVRDWFFEQEDMQSTWRRCWGNVTELLEREGGSQGRCGAVTASPDFQLSY